MKPGRELDALIAEKVMGLKPYQLWEDRKYGGQSPTTIYLNKNENDFEIYKQFYPDSKRLFILPAQFKPYSTDIAAAWEVVEKLKSPLTTLETCDVLGVLKWTCRLSKEGRIVSAMAETAPHAICLAALKVVSPD